MRAILLSLVLLFTACVVQAQPKPAAKPAAAKPAVNKPGVKPTSAKPGANVAAAKPDSLPDEDQVVKKVAELPLTLKGAKVDGDYVIIEYALPYTGMVELRLFDGTTKRQVFRDQYIQAIGDNRIRLKTTAFKPGTAYTFQLTFKGRDTLGRIQV